MQAVRPCVARAGSYGDATAARLNAEKIMHGLRRVCVLPDSLDSVGFRTEAVRTTVYEPPKFADVCAGRQHVVARTAGCAHINYDTDIDLDKVVDCSPSLQTRTGQPVSRTL